jgi:hypothetical protein
MNRPLLVALLLLLAFGTGIYRLASRVRMSSSQRTKDVLVVALFVTFAAGMFLCFPIWVAFTLSAVAAVCVAADFFQRKGACSVVKPDTARHESY